MKKVFVLTKGDDAARADLIREFQDKKAFFELEWVFSAVPDLSDFFQGPVSDVIRQYSQNDFLIFCSDKFRFNPDFSQEHLDRCIVRAQDFKGDLMAGSTEVLEHLLEIDESLFWISSFKNPLFVIVFRKFFEVILNNDLTNKPIQYLTENIFLTYPLIARQSGSENISPSLRQLKEIKKFYLHE
ncbi:hypothetical protein [Chryseobacterium hagamense]|uniref:Uncharacterized protein n=1 Tax=Chryseobacterium hagamense TaxID=395935 RepID=A0A511YS69_9FLAO|nr:hypothetical protein [Chryseobacterium hagamense]GEN78026.1 hypothetical protein CHA01nite_37660 [Chryseobacterium hagamense]